MAPERTPPEPYSWGIAALGRRELTSRQLRDRLTRRGCSAEAIDAAIARLTREGLLDDTRAARAFARTEARVKHRGPLRIRRSLEAMGVSRDVASAATADGFEDQSVPDALETALRRKLRGPLTDDREARRLVAYLVRQGFDLADAVEAVRKHRQRE